MSKNLSEWRDAVGPSSQEEWSSILVPERTEETQASFYAYVLALQSTGSPTAALKIAHLTQAQVDSKCKLVPAFAKAVEDARTHLLEDLEHLYLTRAVEGIETLEEDSNGHTKRKVTKNLDGLEFLLKALAPEKYDRNSKANASAFGVTLSLNILGDVQVVPAPKEEKVIEAEIDKEESK